SFVCLLLTVGYTVGGVDIFSLVDLDVEDFYTGDMSRKNYFIPARTSSPEEQASSTSQQHQLTEDINTSKSHLPVVASTSAVQNGPSSPRTSSAAPLGPSASEEDVFNSSDTITPVLVLSPNLYGLLFLLLA
ncbi:unnamed protein product, partial [Amoebophrya sp. A120]